jgi:hypothetical protein
MVHGHVHNYEGRKLEYVTDFGSRVVNAYGYTMLELDVPERAGAMVPHVLPVGSELEAHD